MAYDKFLSQDEVDELLKGVSGEADTPKASEPALDDSGVRPYNLATQERIIRGRLHTLEIINIIQQNKIKAILVEPYVDQKAPKFIAEKTGARVVVLYPSVGGTPQITDYLTLFDVDTDALVAALGGN